ncbi:acylphosphatase [Lactococcus raffinolactis]|uniref:acylphosphatase n=1 Tax=Pseudolactococcus raffinolactis TaxID=1366 RepID=UPI0014368CB6|nr:acylphosphatase [Lactococcus raffinolactis]QIW61075.1 acylphosphatase [Lactococcus raffinolactis]
MNKVKLNATGCVQGVGFRYMTFQLANRLSIKGTVKNESDGSVTIFAQSDDKLSLQKFISEVRKSPSPYGRVDYLDVKIDNSPDFDDFQMLN